jgi:hypothetical protein
MQNNRRTTQTNEVIGALVFYRREGEPAERERLGLLDQVGSSSLHVATSERLPHGAMLHLRIYSPAAPPGFSELNARGVVQRSPEGARSVAVSLLDPGGADHDRLQAFLQALARVLRPAPAYAPYGPNPAPAYAQAGASSR